MTNADHRDPIGSEWPEDVPPRIASVHPVALRHPDTDSSWIVVLLARAPVGTALIEPTLLVSRLDRLVETVPLLGSRLRHDGWYWAEPPDIEIAAVGEDPLAVLPLQRFQLEAEAPVRIVCAADGGWLALCAHHFAFDGLGMVSIMRSLVSGRPEPVTAYTASSVSSRPEAPWSVLARIARPADRVAPSAPRPGHEVFEVRSVEVRGPGITSRLAEASVAALAEHNRARGARFERVGVSVAVGGVEGGAATYRRVDLRPDADVRSTVAQALARVEVPREMVRLPRAARLARPLVGRLSDTVLVSNLGRCVVPGAQRVELYPVARGRSAVAIGLTGADGGSTSLTLRARHLSSSDAITVIDGIADRLQQVTSATPADQEGPG